MAKAATVKDVLYALEFTGAVLCMWPSPGGHKNAWSLEPAGLKVTPSVASDAMLATGSIVGIKHPRAEAAYVWRSAA